MKSCQAKCVPAIIVGETTLCALCLAITWNYYQRFARANGPIGAEKRPSSKRASGRCLAPCDDVSSVYQTLPVVEVKDYGEQLEPYSDDVMRTLHVCFRRGAYDGLAAVWFQMPETRDAVEPD